MNLGNRDSTLDDSEFDKRAPSALALTTDMEQANMHRDSSADLETIPGNPSMLRVRSTSPAPWSPFLRRLPALSRFYRHGSAVRFKDWLIQ
jgi:hypothetical protein